MSRPFGNRKKKVTFGGQLIYREAAGESAHRHRNVIRSHFALLVKELKLSSPFYRALKEKGILTTEQVGQIELESLPDLKVAKLLEIVRNADSHVFKSFCSVLGEMGYWYLAQTLQTATEEKEWISSTGGSRPTHSTMQDWNSVKLSHSIPEPGCICRNDKQTLKEIFLLSKEANKNLKEDNLELGQKVGLMREEYLQRLQVLEEELASVTRERDMSVRECNITILEIQELQNLNHELQELIIKLENSKLNATRKYPGYSVDMVPVPPLTDGQISLLLTFNQHGQITD
ncbi:uncharacterized protein LOC127572748 isoform X1 [Pristis pectinata]|uniref:uncharacterized protein LOC127572748 isoform X1 n=1 Tax=Pristis pectinata TaxID=685728 RepID=UPI00223D7B57|nr:uncharacterized protein LOC127572748 isoform X1 [Pristis pectinata]